VLGVKQHAYAKYPMEGMLKKRMALRPASASNLEYTLSGFGKGLPLIYYQPKEGGSGASVNWLGARKTIDRSFYLSGKFPRRKRSGISGWVSQRKKPGRWALYRPQGPGVPDAMRTGAVSRTWEAEAAARLPAAMRDALISIMRGR
jgi:hypothetical protein